MTALLILSFQIKRSILRASLLNIIRYLRNLSTEFNKAVFSRMRSTAPTFWYWFRDYNEYECDPHLKTYLLADVLYRVSIREQSSLILTIAAAQSR